MCLFRCDSSLIVYTDTRCRDDRKSTSGFAFAMSIAAVSLSSKKQSIVTLSNTEVESVAATTCACQALWFEKDIGLPTTQAIWSYINDV